MGHACFQGTCILFHCEGCILHLPIVCCFKFQSLLQNTLSMAGVGDGITSMAVHPHLPILAIGSMGQVSEPARRFSLKQCLNRAFSGCSDVLGRNWSAGAPDTVRPLALFVVLLLAFGALFVDARAGTTMDFWGSASDPFPAWRFILSRQVYTLSLLNALCRPSLALISHCCLAAHPCCRCHRLHCLPLWSLDLAIPL